MSADLGQLSVPERNRYFYGLLMDAERFQKDQDYFNSKRALLNRFVSGFGVICGLGLTFTPPSGASPGTLLLGPGIAIDGAGREVLVPAPTPIDLGHLTDATGNPTSPVPAGSTIIIALAYVEKKTDAVAVLVPDCDYPNGCAPSTIAEGFTILVRLATGPAPPIPPGGFGSFPALGTALQADIANQIAGGYSAVPADTSVALGRLSLPGGPLDAVSDRPVIYDNTLLYQLLVALATQVSQLAGVTLAYVSGDNQTAKSGTALSNPLVVAVLDGNGNPIPGGPVPQFVVSSGGGSVGAVTAAGPGQYQTFWTLGSSGSQTVTVQAPPSALTVTFHASITP
jgi:hypothetical protein